MGLETLETYEPVLALTRKLFKATRRSGLVTVLALATNSCTPNNPSQTEKDIAILEKALADSTKDRPDCEVKDVNQEMSALLEGRLTYTPRPIVTDQDRERIMLQRTVYRDMLRVQALILSDKKLDRRGLSIALGNVYDALYRDGIRGIPMPPQNEYQVEMIHQASCHVTKAFSLKVPYAIANLKATLK